MLFHDTNVRERDFGVWRLWDELRRSHRSFEFLHGHGLGVLLLGHDVPAPAAALGEISDPGAINRVRERFAALGQRYVLEGESIAALAALRAEAEAAQQDLHAESMRLARSAEANRTAGLHAQAIATETSLRQEFTAARAQFAEAVGHADTLDRELKSARAWEKRAQRAEENLNQLRNEARLRRGRLLAAHTAHTRAAEAAQRPLPRRGRTHPNWLHNSRQPNTPRILQRWTWLPGSMPRSRRSINAKRISMLFSHPAHGKQPPSFARLPQAYAGSATVLNSSATHWLHRDEMRAVRLLARFAAASDQCRSASIPRQPKCPARCRPTATRSQRNPNMSCGPRALTRLGRAVVRRLRPTWPLGSFHRSSYWRCSRSYPSSRPMPGWTACSGNSFAGGRQFSASTRLRSGVVRHVQARAADNPRFVVVRMPLDDADRQNLAQFGQPRHVLVTSAAALPRDHALYSFAAASAENPDMRLIYSDEDHLGADGKRSAPWFKPDFSPELLRHSSYLGACALLHQSGIEPDALLDRIAKTGGAAQFLLLQAGSLPDQTIMHLPYHIYTTTPPNRAADRGDSDRSAPSEWSPPGQHYHSYKRSVGPVGGLPR